MSWSINWDSSQNKNTFVNENAEFLAKFKNNEPTTVAPVTTQAPTEKNNNSSTSYNTGANRKGYNSSTSYNTGTNRKSYNGSTNNSCSYYKDR